MFLDFNRHFLGENPQLFHNFPRGFPPGLRGGFPGVPRLHLGAIPDGPIEAHQPGRAQGVGGDRGIQDLLRPGEGQNQGGRYMLR